MNLTQRDCHVLVDDADFIEFVFSLNPVTNGAYKANSS